MHSDKYTYRVVWSDEDQEYIGLCAEFPSLSWLDTSPEKALRGIRATVYETVEDMSANNETIPAPLSLRSFSGRFVVRIPPELHRQLTIKASEAGISLNRLAAMKLSF